MTTQPGLDPHAGRGPGNGACAGCGRRDVSSGCKPGFVEKRRMGRLQVRSGSEPGLPDGRDAAHTIPEDCPGPVDEPSDHAQRKRSAEPLRSSPGMLGELTTGTATGMQASAGH